MLDYKLFSGNLRRLMMKKKISSKELAQKLKVHNSLIAHWRVGRSANPTAKQLVKLAKVFNVTIDSLFE